MRPSMLKSLFLLGAASFAAARPASNVHDLTKRQEDKVASSYYTQWHAEAFPLDKVSWDKYTHLLYAFMNSTVDPSSTSLPDADAKLIPEFVAKAHEQNKKALIAWGGWTGSLYFSWNVGDDKNRTAFADAVLGFLDKYQFDGVNFDWEYPNNPGIGCNAISPNDTANFLTFLQLLRSKTDKLITAAVSINPFNDANQKPSTNVSAFGDVFDWLTLMVYDIWGNWSPKVGPNAALRDSCAPKDYQMGSAESAVKAWTGAGFPVNKLVMGLPTYGHSFNVTKENAFNGPELAEYPSFDAQNRPRGDEWSDPSRTNACGVVDPVGDTWNFWALIKDGLLKEDGQPAPETPYRFDNCSQTAYLYRNATGVMISYDAPETYAAKGKFIQEQGLKGFSMWETAGDYNDILLDAVHSGAGF